MLSEYEKGSGPFSGTVAFLEHFETVRVKFGLVTVSAHDVSLTHSQDVYMTVLVCLRLPGMELYYWVS